MAVAALALFAVWGIVAFGLRTAVQLRNTGDTGFRRPNGRPGSIDWWIVVGFVTALLAGVAGPVLALAGVDPVDFLDDLSWLRWLGTGLAIAGIIGTFVTQMAMGDSWRVGVDRSERTELVSEGPFAVVRNPIFTAMFVTAAGLALMVPNLVALAGFALLVLTIEGQVRLIEEPHLVATHGPAYASYASRVGRFLPGIGRLHFAG